MNIEFNRTSGYFVAEGGISMDEIELREPGRLSIRNTGVFWQA